MHTSIARTLGATGTILLLLAVIIGCGRTIDYQPISGIAEDINALGRKIAEAQRSEVWTGGNEYSGCYTDADAAAFRRSGKLERLVADMKASPYFQKGVAAFKALPKSQQDSIREAWNQPLDRTWAQNGKIGEGTTDAGQQVERDIANALTALFPDSGR